MLVIFFEVTKEFYFYSLDLHEIYALKQWCNFSI